MTPGQSGEVWRESQKMCNSILPHSEQHTVWNNHEWSSAKPWTIKGTYYLWILKTYNELPAHWITMKKIYKERAVKYVNLIIQQLKR